MTWKVLILIALSISVSLACNSGLLEFALWCGGFQIRTACVCNNEGAINSDCDANAECQCQPNIIGPRRDSCIQGRFGFPDCSFQCQEGRKCELAIVNSRYSPNMEILSLSGKSKEQKDGIAHISVGQWQAGFVDGQCLFCSRFEFECHTYDPERKELLPAALTMDRTIEQRKYNRIIQGNGALYSVDVKGRINRLKSLSQGWESLSGSHFANSEASCYAIKDDDKIVTFVQDVTQGTSRIAIFNIQTRQWTQGPEVAINGWLDINSWACFMLDDKHFYVEVGAYLGKAEDEKRKVIDITNGQVQDSFLTGMGSAKIRSGSAYPGAGGIFYMGGITEGTPGPIKDIFFLPKGGHQWTKLRPELSKGMTEIAACLY